MTFVNLFISAAETKFIVKIVGNHLSERETRLPADCVHRDAAQKTTSMPVPTTLFTPHITCL